MKNYMDGMKNLLVMDKNQQQLINTYARKRLMVPPLYPREIKYFFNNNIIKEKLNAEKYIYTNYPFISLTNMIIDDINMTNYFDFSKVDGYQLETIMEYLILAFDKADINGKNLNHIINQIFQTVNTNQFDIQHINWFMRYFPILEPYIKERWDYLRNELNKNINNNVRKLNNNG